MDKEDIKKQIVDIIIDVSPCNITADEIYNQLTAQKDIAIKYLTNRIYHLQNRANNIRNCGMSNTIREKTVEFAGTDCYTLKK